MKIFKRKMWAIWNVKDQSWQHEIEGNEQSPLAFSLRKSALHDLYGSNDKVVRVEVTIKPIKKSRRK